MRKYFFYADKPISSDPSKGLNAEYFRTHIENAVNGKFDEIFIYTNCEGGDFIEAEAIDFELTKCEIPITFKVVGIGASALTYIASPHKIVLTDHSHWMVHLTKGGGSGTADDVSASAKILLDAETNLLDRYSKRTGLTIEELKSKLKNDLHLNPTEALAGGWIDGIEDKISAIFTKPEMNKNKTLLQKITAILTGEILAGMATLKDGTTMVHFEGEIEEGTVIYLDEEMTKLAPAGDHTTDKGVTVTLDDAGKVVSIKKEAEETTANAEVTELKAQIENLTAQLNAKSVEASTEKEVTAKLNTRITAIMREIETDSNGVFKGVLEPVLSNTPHNIFDDIANSLHTK